MDLISRQAAIDALDVLCQEHRYKIPGELETYSQYNEAWQDALDRAEGAIGNLPSAQPEPCEDAVSREAVLDMLHQECSSIVENFMKEKINAMPSVTPKAEQTEYIPDTKAMLSEKDCVDLSERVTATFYDDEHEEWSQKTVTIRDVLDFVCDEYTVLPSAQPEQSFGEWKKDFTGYVEMLNMPKDDFKGITEYINEAPFTQLEACEGCKHLGKWENEVEYGYPSPCTRCKRRVEDHYER